MKESAEKNKVCRSLSDGEISGDTEYEGIVRLILKDVVIDNNEGALVQAEVLVEEEGRMC